MKTTLAMTTGLMMTLAQTAAAGHYQTQNVWVPAEYEIRERRIVVPAEYETFYKKVWVEPAYELREKTIFVPAGNDGFRLNINTGDFKLGIGLGDHSYGGYHKKVLEKVCVREGYWTLVEETVLVKPECIKIVHERVCVREGYWKKITVSKYQKHPKSFPRFR